MNGWRTMSDSAEPSSQRSLWDLVRSFELSNYREKLFEQIFCSELLQGCWLAGLPPVEIDRPFVDFQGYDLAATCAGITRHIQLKASRAGQITVHRNLALKPSACVVNMEASIESDPERIRLRYRYFGSGPGKPLNLDGLKPARKAFNTRLTSGAFGKAERVNHLRIPHAHFSASIDVTELAKRLFGVSAAVVEPGIIRWLTPEEAAGLFLGGQEIGQDADQEASPPS